MQRRRCKPGLVGYDSDVVKDPRGHCVDRGGVPCALDVSQQCQRWVFEFGGRRGKRRRVDLSLQFGGPLGEGDEGEVELIADAAQEGEGGDGEGMGDVEICRQ